MISRKKRKMTTKPTEVIGEGVSLFLGDCLAVMKGLPENSVDSIVTDPPYALVGNSRNGSSQPGDLNTPYGRSGPSKKRGFMGKEWDGELPGIEIWREALRVAKPGAHLLAFGGSRTFHRLAVNIEDAGWEIRDTIMWVYGSGFPKSKNVALAIDKEAGLPNKGHRIATASRHHPDGTFEPNGESIPAYEGKTEESRPWSGWGTAMKPCFEPVIVARKPLDGTVAQNVLKHGTGGMNIDDCRVGTEKVTINTWDDGAKPFGGGAGHEYSSKQVEGRWPGNLIHDGSKEVLKLFPVVKSGKMGPWNERNTEESPHGIYGKFNKEHPLAETYGDSGSAARFFYCAKADSVERHEGVGHPGNQFKHGVTLQKVSETETKGNNHPTVKPVDLMKYLCRLVTPPGGIVLDPFMGSGSTGKAAAEEGFRFLGIERGEEEFQIAVGRVRFAYAMVGWPGAEMEIDI